MVAGRHHELHRVLRSAGDIYDDSGGMFWLNCLGDRALKLRNYLVPHFVAQNSLYDLVMGGFIGKRACFFPSQFWLRYGTPQAKRLSENLGATAHVPFEQAT